MRKTAESNEVNKDSALFQLNEHLSLRAVSVPGHTPGPNNAFGDLYRELLVNRGKYL